MDVEGIEDRTSLESWLSEQSRETCVAIANRAAMRVAPLFWQQVPPVLANGNTTPHPVSRALMISGVAVAIPSPKVRSAASAIKATAATDFAGTETTDANATAAFAARSAFAACASAANAAVASDAAIAAAEAAAFAASAASAVWIGIRKDGAIVEKSGSPAILFSTPLWGEAGNPLEDSWTEVRKGWSEAGEGWQFWVDWYESALAGRFPNWDLLLEVVLLPKDLWEGEPERLNSEIRHLVLRAAISIQRHDHLPRSAVISLQELDQIDAETERLRSELSSLTGQFSRIDEDLRRRTEQLTELQIQQGQFQSALEETLAKFSGRFESFEADLKKRVSAAIDAVKADREIEAPVELWKEKEKEHWWRQMFAYLQFLTGLFVVAAMVATAAMALVGWPEAFSEASIVLERAYAAPACDPAQNPAGCSGINFRAVFISASVLTLFTIVLWFIRLKMKEYLAERHLMLDARERRAFAQVYLGLLATKDSSDEAKEQRGTIYSALFRHSSDGIIKDESGLDPSIAAAVSKFLSK